MRRLLITTCLTLLALTACGGAKSFDASDTASVGGSASDDTGSDQGSDDTASADEPEPYWFVLSGELTVIEGVLVEATLGFIVYPEDTESPPICAFSRAATAVSPEELTPDASIFVWSSAITEPAEDECDPAVTIPDPIQIGVGLMHPDLVPALTAAGLDSGPLYGVYAALGDQSGCAEGSGDACVFGYAADLSDPEGETPAAEKPPMPDSTYAFEGVYGFRL